MVNMKQLEIHHVTGCHWADARRSQGNLPPTSRAFSSPTGYSLIELLVVVAIIGMLATLLLTASYRVKTKVREQQSKTHLKQWYSAMDGYSNDKDDLIPREGFQKNGRVTADSWANVAAPEAADTWYNALPPD